MHNIGGRITLCITGTIAHFSDLKIQSRAQITKITIIKKKNQTLESSLKVGYTTYELVCFSFFSCFFACLIYMSRLNTVN